MTAIDRVLLLGMMGAGKTTVGQALGVALRWSYLDNDELVADATGAAKESLLERAGIAALRSAETAALLLALHREGPLVAGIAGGAVLDPHNVRLLANRSDGALVVWLRAPVSVLAARIVADPQDRPWLSGDPVAALSRLAEERDPGYAAAADLTVDVGDVALDEVVARIAAVVTAGAG
jgi:shikimate kinase